MGELEGELAPNKISVLMSICRRFPSLLSPTTLEILPDRVTVSLKGFSLEGGRFQLLAFLVTQALIETLLSLGLIFVKIYSPANFSNSFRLSSAHLDNLSYKVTKKYLIFELAQNHSAIGNPQILPSPAGPDDF